MRSIFPRNPPEVLEILLEILKNFFLGDLFQKFLIKIHQEFLVGTLEKFLLGIFQECLLGILQFLVFLRCFLLELFLSIYQEQFSRNHPGVAFDNSP